MQSKRRQTRIKVLQVLYAHIIAKDPVEKVKKDLLDNPEEPINRDFANQLIERVLAHTDLLDKLIEAKVENWEMERIALLDKIVLRMGLSEILYFNEIPPKVSINEAIDIAKEYGTKSSGKFVNGILDAILTELKNNGKLNKKGRGLIDTTVKKDEK
jgi:N utilization substance protein B